MRGTDRHIHITDVSIDKLLDRVNSMTAFPVTDEGWLTGDKAEYKLITAFPNLSGAYTAVLEKL